MANAKAYKFSEGGARRIVDAVRRVERTPSDLVGDRAGSGGASPWPIWIWTTGADTTGDYPWEQIRRNSGNTAWEALPTGLSSVATTTATVTGTGKTAREVNGASGLPTHTIGLLRPVIDGATSADLRFLFLVPGTTTRYLARITGQASLSSTSVAVGGGSAVTVEYRWKYAFAEVERDGNGVADVASGRTGATGGSGATIYAINTREINHTGAYSWGVDITSASYPTGFRPQAIGCAGALTSGSPTHRYDDVVEITEVIDKNGNMVRHFAAFGSHDGPCTP